MDSQPPPPFFSPPGLFHLSMSASPRLGACAFSRNWSDTSNPRLKMKLAVFSRMPSTLVPN